MLAKAWYCEICSKRYALEGKHMQLKPQMHHKKAPTLKEAINIYREAYQINI